MNVFLYFSHDTCPQVSLRRKEENLWITVLRRKKAYPQVFMWIIERTNFAIDFEFILKFERIFERYQVKSLAISRFPKSIKFINRPS